MRETQLLLWRKIVLRQRKQASINARSVLVRPEKELFLKLYSLYNNYQKQIVCGFTVLCVMDDQRCTFCSTMMYKRLHWDLHFSRTVTQPSSTSVFMFSVVPLAMEPMIIAASVLSCWGASSSTSHCSNL